MAIAFGTAGAVAASATSPLAVPHPASIAAGDLLVLTTNTKFNPNGPTTPTGWTLIRQTSGGMGANGVDAGTILTSVWVKEADGTETGNLSLTLHGSNNVTMGRMFRYTKTNAAHNWDIASAGGSDNTTGTAWSVTATANPGITAGDMMVFASGTNTDAYTWSAQASTCTGITVWGTMSERQDSFTGTGSDISLIVADRLVTTGTSSAAPVYTMTSSGSTTNGPAGSTIFLRLREVPPRYWVGNGGSWSSTTKWSATTGGASGASIPTSKTKVFFDANSFSSAGQTVTLTADAFCEDMDWSAVDSAPTFNMASWNLSCLGDFILSSNMVGINNGSSLYVYCENGTYTVNPAGVPIDVNLLQIGLGAASIANLGGAIDITGELGLTEAGATFNTNNHNITCNEFSLGNETVSIGTSTITASILDTDFTGGGTNTFNEPNAVFNIEAGGYLFMGASHTVGTVNLLGNTSVYTMGQNINNLVVSPGTTVTFDTTSGTTIDIQSLTADGTALSPIVFAPISTTNYQFNKTSGTVSVYYVTITRCIGAGGATWNAYASTNGGNNTNWNFLALPSADFLLFF